MRHQKHHRTLGVKKEHRSALLSNLAASLIKKGRIKTTLAKARALRPFVEKVVTLAKKGTLHHRRLALTRVRDEDAVTVLFNSKAPQFAKRAGGYTRIYKLAPRRLGDGAAMALVEFVGAEDVGYRKSRGKKAAAKQSSPAAAEPSVPAADPAPPAPAAAPAR